MFLPKQPVLLAEHRAVDSVAVKLRRERDGWQLRPCYWISPEAEAPQVIQGDITQYVRAECDATGAYLRELGLTCAEPVFRGDDGSEPA